MFKTIAAAAALLLIAGAVTVWSATGNVEASTPPAAAKGDRLDIRPMHDRKQPTGQARDVRLVALNQSII